MVDARPTPANNTRRFFQRQCAGTRWRENSEPLKSMSENNTPEITPESGLSSHALLGLGLYVVETRSRRRDKSLQGWKPLAAFVHHDAAEDFYEQYHEIGYARILRPNDKIHQ